MSQCFTKKRLKQFFIKPRPWFAVSILLSMIVVMPTAQAAGCKLPKSYFKNVSCTASRGYFLAVKDFGEPVALIDSKGKAVVDLSRYQKVDANKIVDGLMPVLRNSRVGYIDLQGREVIRADYDMLSESGNKGWARPVSEGRIVVKKDRKYGVISTTNQVIVPFSASISMIDNYRSGTAQVRKNQDISWVDKNGKDTSDPNARKPTQMSTTSNQPLTTAESSTPIKSQSNTQLANRFTTLEPQQQDGKWGFVDERNVIMITYSFDEVRPFSEGLAGVRIDSNWGFLNLGGELVIPFRYDNDSIVISEDGSNNSISAFVFNNGKAWVSNLKNGDKVCIDTTGETVSCD